MKKIISLLLLLVLPVEATNAPLNFNTSTGAIVNLPTGVAANFPASGLSVNGVPVDAIALGTGVGAALANPLNSSAGIAGFNSPATSPLLLAIGFDGDTNGTNSGIIVGVSVDGSNYYTHRSSVFIPGKGAIRDIAPLRNADGTLYTNAAGYYFFEGTSGNFGQCGYLTVFDSQDWVNFNFVADIPITGSSVQVLATTVTTTASSATITLGATTGLVNGQVYGISGNANLPVEAAFLYNSGTGTTQTLGYQSSYNSLVSGAALTATANGSAVASKINFVNNTWNASWQTDTDGTIIIVTAVSTTPGFSQRSPGEGYIVCNNPGTFTSFSDYTPLVFNVGSTGLTASTFNSGGVGGPYSGVYYFTESTGHYGTSSTARGTYVMQPSLGVPAGTGWEGGLLQNWGDPNHWMLNYLSVNPSGAGDRTGKSESFTGLTGTWSTPFECNVPDLHGVAAMNPTPVRNSKDLQVAINAISPQPSSMFIGSDPYNNGGGNNSYFMTKQGFMSWFLNQTLTGSSGLEPSTQADFVLSSSGGTFKGSLTQGTSTTATTATFTSNVNAAFVTINDALATGSNTFPLTVLSSGMTGGGTFLELGKDASTDDLGYMRFNYVGANSTSNNLTWGFFGADNLMKLLPNGNVSAVGSISGVGLLDTSFTSGITKFGAGGLLGQATAGTDYQAPVSGSGFVTAASGTLSSSWTVAPASSATSAQAVALTAGDFTGASGVAAAYTIRGGNNTGGGSGLGGNFVADGGTGPTNNGNVVLGATNAMQIVVGASGAQSANGNYTQIYRSKAVFTPTPGTLGESMNSLIASGSAVGLTTATPANVTSLSLTAGDWEVSGNINFSASTATVSQKSGGIGTTTATVPTDGTEVYSGVAMTLLSATDSITIPTKRINVSSTTTVYLVANCTFTAGSVSAFGALHARRL